MEQITMLQKLHERIQGIIAWVIISLISVTFLLFGVEYYLQSNRDQAVVAEVNGEPITQQAFELNYRRARQFEDPAQMTAANDLVLKQKIVDDMVLNQVKVQAAVHNGFEVTPAQSDAAIVSIPQFQADGLFSAERYQQALSNALYTHQSFRDEVRQGMLLNQQRFAFMGTAIAFPDEIQRFVKLNFQTRDYDYVLIPTQRFEAESTISDEEIQAYYQQHAAAFQSEEKISVEFIRLSLQDIKANLEFSDEDIARHYEENQANYVDPARWQVAHILFAFPEGASFEQREQIKEKAQAAFTELSAHPDLFAQKVTEWSDDKLSVKNQGVLPWIVAGQSEFDATLMNLTTVGQISEPVESRNGYQVFKLLSYKSAASKELAEVKEAIREQLVIESAQVAYTKALEQIADLSYQTPDSLTPVAEALNLKVEETPLFSRQGLDGVITRNQDIIQAAFSDALRESGDNSELIQLDNDSVVVLRVKQYVAARQQELAKVKSAIVTQLAREKAQAQAKQLGEQLAANVASQSVQNKLLNEHHLQWHAVTEAARDLDGAVEGNVNAIAFNVAKVGNTQGEFLDSGDYVLIRLKAVREGVAAMLDSEQLASITQQIETSYGKVDYDLYIYAVLNQAKISKKLGN